MSPQSSCSYQSLFFFFFNDTATTEIYTLSLHDALPIYSRKVPLLPDAPINQRDLVLREFGERVAREIRKDGVRMFARITDHLGHRRFFPSIVNLVMAFGARLRTGVVRRSGGGLLLGLLSAGKRAKTAEDRKSVV